MVTLRTNGFIGVCGLVITRGIPGSEGNFSRAIANVMKIRLILRLQDDQVSAVIEVIQLNSSRPYFHNNLLCCSNTWSCTCLM